MTTDYLLFLWQNVYGSFGSVLIQKKSYTRINWVFVQQITNCKEIR